MSCGSLERGADQLAVFSGQGIDIDILELTVSIPSGFLLLKGEFKVNIMMDLFVYVVVGCWIIGGVDIRFRVSLSL